MAVAWDAERFRHPAEWVQENLNKADAALSDEFKRRYPIRSRTEIEAEHPNRWLAILPTRVDRHNQTSEGRLLATARGRRSLEQQVRPLLAEFPRRYPLTYYNLRQSGATGDSRSANRHGDAQTAS